MAMTNYPLVKDAWTACGAADDCTIQTDAEGVVRFTTDTSLPGAGVMDGLDIGIGPGLQRGATVQRTGRTLYARIISGAVGLNVER